MAFYTPQQPFQGGQQVPGFGGGGGAPQFTGFNTSPYMTNQNHQPATPTQPSQPNVYGGAPDPGSGNNYKNGVPINPATPKLPGQETGPSMEGPLSGAGYGEDWYKQYGQDLMKTPSASEDLYARGVEGSNPFYDYAQQQTIKAINDASAARGNFNSSYTMKNIGNAVADLRGQQAHELGQLAGQSDTSRYGRYDRGASYADTAQKLLEDRAQRQIDSRMGLAQGQAGLVGGFYGEAGRESQQAEMARIEAMLKKSGMSLEETKFMMDMIGNIGSTATKVIGAGA